MTSHKNVFSLLTVLLALACGSEPAQTVAAPVLKSAPSAIFATKTVHLWAHSPDLEAPARSAAARILAATGLIVDVNAPGASDTDVPLFWSEQNGKWIGLCGPDRAWIAIDTDLKARQRDLYTVVLHEILHAFGATHLPNGNVMSVDVQGSGNGLLSEDDLIDVCAVASCTAFVSEK